MSLCRAIGFVIALCRVAGFISTRLEFRIQAYYVREVNSVFR